MFRVGCDWPHQGRSLRWATGLLVVLAIAAAPAVSAQQANQPVAGLAPGYYYPSTGQGFGVPPGAAAAPLAAEVMPDPAAAVSAPQDSDPVAQWLGNFQAALVGDSWSWQPLPDGLIYRTYLAGMKEPRLASMWVHERELGWIWDIALGARVGILRYGTPGADRPEGWQFDVEGAAFPRLMELTYNRDLMSVDFRGGVPISFGYGRYQTKFGYYHLSSHLGDEFMLAHPEFPRINFSRDVLIWGHSFYLTDDLRLYGEAGWAFYVDGGSKPWEFQFGVDYSPMGHTGQFRGAPFAAVNAHLRQEVDFGGNFVAQTGWQWRSTSGHLLRAGLQYFNGKSEQFQFFRRSEEKIGLAFWYDF